MNTLGTEMALANCPPRDHACLLARHVITERPMGLCQQAVRSYFQRIRSKQLEEFEFHGVGIRRARLWLGSTGQDGSHGPNLTWRKAREVQLAYAIKNTGEQVAITHNGGARNDDQPDRASQDELPEDKATDASPEQAAFNRFREAIEKLDEDAPLDELTNAVQRLIAPRLPAGHTSNTADTHTSTRNRADPDPPEDTKPDEA